jgi:hypothetical protein
VQQGTGTATIALLSSANLRGMNKRDTRNLYKEFSFQKRKRYLLPFFLPFLFSPLYIKQKPESTMSKYLHEKWKQNKGEKYQKLKAQRRKRYLNQNE